MIILDGINNEDMQWGSGSKSISCPEDFSYTHSVCLCMCLINIVFETRQATSSISSFTVTVLFLQHMFFFNYDLLKEL